MSANHDCVARVNEQLREHHTMIIAPLSLGTPSRELIGVATVKRFDAPRGKKAMSLFATFCPFCGKKLDGAA